MQSLSIAYDFDLKYEEKDLIRYYEVGWEYKPAGLYLNKVSDSEYFYAKPIIYSVLSAPLVRIFGSQGFIYLNALAVFLIYSVLRANFSSKKLGSYAMVVPVVAVLASTIIFYIRTIHPDITIALLLIMAFNFYLKFIDRKQLRFVLFSSLFMGLGIYEKPTFLLFVPFLVCGMWLAMHQNPIKLFKILLLYILSMILSYMVPTIFTAENTNTLTSYQGDRWYFEVPPYSQEEISGMMVSTENIFSLDYLKGNILGGLYNFPKNIIYLFIGRQTGILVYFPITLLIIINIKGVRSLKDHEKLLIIGLAFYQLFYVLVFSNNYYGGVTSFGNRYFLQIYPALLLATTTYFSVEKKGVISLLIILYSISFYTALLFNPEIKVKSHYHFAMGSTVAQYLPIEITLLPSGRGLDVDDKSYLWIYGDHHLLKDAKEIRVNISKPIYVVIQTEVLIPNGLLKIGWSDLNSKIEDEMHKEYLSLHKHKVIYYGDITETKKVPNFIYIVELNPKIFQDNGVVGDISRFDIVLRSFEFLDVI